MTYFEDIRKILAVKGMTLSAKAVLIYLKDKQGDNGNCWPSLTTICEGCGVSRPTVVRALKELQELGKVDIKRPDKPAIGKTSHYSVDLTGKEPLLVKKLNRLRNVTRTGKEPLPQLVKNLYPNDSLNDPITSQTKKQPKKLIPINPEYFITFWKAYPKKTAKKEAEKAFNKIHPDETLLETILDGIEQNKKTDQWNKDDGKYIPFPATWLNGRRWEDELHDFGAECTQTREITEAELAELDKKMGME
jgi:hypothetical protein